MPSLADHHSSQFVKVLYIGDSGTGKTGSIASLINAGYKIKFLDMDNGLDVLVHYVDRDKLKNVDYETRRNKYKASVGAVGVTGQASAFVDSVKLMEKWSDGSDPATWGTDTIFVLDSLSTFGKAALEWAKGMNPLAQSGKQQDARQWFFTAQQALENVIALLTSEAFHCNVIVISHINWKEMQDGTTKGYANAIGSALGPTLARYFNTLILAE